MKKVFVVLMCLALIGAYAYRFGDLKVVLNEARKSWAHKPGKPGDVTGSIQKKKPIGQTSPKAVACSSTKDIDTYLWTRYQATPKVDSGGDFTAKDPAAAKHAGMSVREYVIGGMDTDFKCQLFQLFKALEQEQYKPGITSGYRDNYRQALASGRKNRPGCSFHGGTLVGGHGKGLAADIVSVEGSNRSERLANSQDLWDWVVKHGKSYGVGRPYGVRDAPHVAPLTSLEFNRAERRKACRTAKPT